MRAAIIAIVSYVCTPVCLYAICAHSLCCVRAYDRVRVVLMITRLIRRKATPKQVQLVFYWEIAVCVYTSACISVFISMRCVGVSASRA